MREQKIISHRAIHEPCGPVWDRHWSVSLRLWCGSGAHLRERDRAEDAQEEHRRARAPNLVLLHTRHASPTTPVAQQPFCRAVAAAAAAAVPAVIATALCPDAEPDTARHPHELGEDVEEEEACKDWDAPNCARVR